ncbi:MAG TPA: hypothetical protein VGZ47_02840 [Gemmataceae bacterium]|jgi:hypothetical protein|nr:hypothetical protein [Gemmataceae bacterium]
MNLVSPQLAGDQMEIGFRQRPLWWLLLLALVLAQIATVQTLFSTERTWAPVRDSRPILNGRHPLHLYHGLLGARAWKDGKAGSCYDLAYQAGYPKTPIFDSGSQPAELFLLLGQERSAAYKIGLAFCCMLVPLLFATSARMVGLGAGSSCLTAALGQLLWWSGPVQQLLLEGSLDWLLAGLLLVLHMAMLVRFQRDSDPLACAGFGLTAALGWFCHPILWAGFAPLFLLFYLVVSFRHGLIWHAGLWLAWGGGLAVNLPWLEHWLRYCWISRPIPGAMDNVMPQSLADWVPAHVAVTPADRFLIGALLIGGMAGVIALLIQGRISAAGLAGATILLLPALALTANYWKPIETIGPSKMIVLACGFASIPCSALAAGYFAVWKRWPRRPLLGMFIGTLVLAGMAWLARSEIQLLVTQSLRAQPFKLGLTPDQETLVNILRSSTTPDARILWEDRLHPQYPHWPALLARGTERSYLGGLDPEAGVEHMHARLSENTLAGRPLSDWSNEELAAFCNRYNIGYIACWSLETVARFRDWPQAEPLASIRESGNGWLFRINRKPSFILKGKAKVIQFDAERIALHEVEPQDGVVVLSLHHQDGWRVSPSNVQIEREIDPYDPIPFLRLRMSGPVMRLTLTWDEP